MMMSSLKQQKRMFYISSSLDMYGELESESVFANWIL